MSDDQKFIETNVTIRSDVFLASVEISTIAGDQSEALAMWNLIAERYAQFNRGYDHKHDDQHHTVDDLARDAVHRVSKLWFATLTDHDREEMLKQAGALIVAALSKHYREVGE